MHGLALDWWTRGVFFGVYVVAVILSFWTSGYTFTNLSNGVVTAFPDTLYEIPRIPMIDYLTVFVLYAVWYIVANIYALLFMQSTEYITPVI